MTINPQTKTIEALNTFIPKSWLPLDAGWSSAISWLGFEFLIIDTFLLEDFILCKSETLTKSILFPNPKPESHVLRLENEVGTVPAAIFEPQSILNTDWKTKSNKLNRQLATPNSNHNKVSFRIQLNTKQCFLFYKFQLQQNIIFSLILSKK